MTRLCSPRSASWSAKSEISWRKLREARLVRGLLVLLRDADELLEVLDPPLRLDRALGLERVDVAASLEHALDELGHRQLERAGHQRLDQRAECLHGLQRRRPHAGFLGELGRLPERDAVRVRVGLEASDRRVADPAPRLVRDPHQRDGVVRVVDHLQVRDHVLDLRPLVELRAADHLVLDRLPDEHVLEHPRLRVRPVEDRDLRAAEALLDEAGDLDGDEPGLGVLVLDLEHADRLAVPQLRPELLRLALAVVRDHRVRAAQDHVRRAVVLLERDHARAGKVGLELHDVPDVRASEGVDGLVRIAHGEEVLVLFGHELQEPVLRVVRVLVLVDEDVAERGLPLLARLGEVLEQLDGEEEHVVEVDGVRGEEPPLVEVVRVGDGLVVEGRDALAVLLGADQVVLRGRDLGVDAARDEALRVALELLEDRLREPDLVGLVVDREVRAVAEPRRLAAEDAAAGGVEGQDPDRARDAAEHVLEPLAHLARRLVREGDREDLLRLDPVRVDQVRDPVREDARLAGAGAGDDEERPLGREDGLPLGGVQVGEIGLR